MREGDEEARVEGGAAVLNNVDREGPLGGGEDEPCSLGHRGSL